MPDKDRLSQKEYFCRPLSESHRQDLAEAVHDVIVYGGSEERVRKILHSIGIRFPLPDFDTVIDCLRRFEHECTKKEGKASSHIDCIVASLVLQPMFAGREEQFEAVLDRLLWGGYSC
ncbi:hypothetical protein QR680_011446 [Steinernema hermaphroditum]|uniref:Uncharacterized protein n=1 Tax=Steinernema hermaphroditum TaxID=289476 RepID=A0AA39LYP4_9BILA|nr:hypothetical protein QR680_011446 [Steinernema hermaphroditum]